MDDELKTKANPTIVLILDYFAVAVILAVMFYMAVIARVMPVDIFTGVLISILSAFGIYKSGAVTKSLLPPKKDTPPTQQG